MENKSSESMIIILFLTAVSIPIAFLSIPIIIMFGLTLYTAVTLARKLNDDVVVQDYNDFRLDKEYYRDILKDYSIGELIYIDRYYTNVEDIVIVTLLKLMQRNIIELTEYGFVINDKSAILKPSDAIILDSITEDGNVVISGKLIREKVKQEIEEDKLVKKANNYRKLKIWELVSIFVGVMACAWIVANISYSFNEYVWIKTIMDVGNLIFATIGIPLFLFTYNRASINRYIRTEKGEELNYKIEGLKKYIKDYSMMNERGANEVELWEDYLIYSVLSGTNMKVYEDMYNYIKIKNKYGIIEFFDEIF